MKIPFIVLAFLPAWTAATDVSGEADKNYNLHFQTTVIDQGHARFHAPYSGANSQLPDPESANSITSTLFLGWKLRPGTEIYVNPELAGGSGMSRTLGIAGFPNGEVYRVGDARPTLSTSRLFIRQVVDLGGGSESIEDGPNQIAGRAPARRMTFVLGKFSLPDYFDDNAYSHDARSQFMNWALMSSIGWDYPADTRGYTWGLMTEYREPAWALRAAAVAEPKSANMMDMDRRIWRAHGLVLEVDRSIAVGGRKGTLRLLGFLNEAAMGNYDDAVALGRASNSIPDITKTRAYGRTKYGFASSDDLELADHLGGFLRLSWNDGSNETWAFSEVDQSAALGIDWNPARWGRSNDHWGLAQIVNGISGAHRRYLADGGHGFMLGDGALHYGPEVSTEIYYKFQANRFLAVSPDAQLVVNPGYNRDRGPVPVWGVRVHAEF